MRNTQHGVTIKLKIKIKSEPPVKHFKIFISAVQPKPVLALPVLPSSDWETFSPVMPFKFSCTTKVHRLAVNSLDNSHTLTLVDTLKSYNVHDGRKVQQWKKPEKNSDILQQMPAGIHLWPDTVNNLNGSAKVTRRIRKNRRNASQNWWRKLWRLEKGVCRGDILVSWSEAHQGRPWAGATGHHHRFSR